MLTNWTGSAGSPAWIHVGVSGAPVRGIFSFRTDGTSPAPFSSLNVGYHVGDEATAVSVNRTRCAQAMDSHVEDWVVPAQVHGTQVVQVSSAHRGRGAGPDNLPLPDCDALITDEPGITLVAMAADCVPILFYDPVHQAIGAAHSGWRGTVGHISRRVLDGLHDAYGTTASTVEVWLGPSIRRCCYEVDTPVAEKVLQEFGPAFLWPRLDEAGKYMLGVHACIRSDLEAAGVQPARIHDTGICTACRTSMLFSHRAEAGRTGRQLGMIQLTRH